MIENIVKINFNLGLPSLKQNDNFQEPKLKPMAASTPTQRPLLKSDSSELNGKKSLPR